jgi:hypothetical protein
MVPWETTVDKTTAQKPIHIGDGIAGRTASRLAPPRVARIAAAACMILAGCAGMQGGSPMANGAGMPGTAGTSAGDYSEGRSDGPGIAGLRGVVQQIELITGREADIAVSGALGAAAAGGPVPGMGSPGGFRVTLRTEDGSVHSVVVGTRPECNVGDRVTYSNGSIARQ